MSKRKLLLADDSITIQKVVNLTFADEGIEVISVGDGDSAMHKFDEFMPDLVMADVNMPGLSGYEVCQIIKQNEETQNIPVILLVGSFEPFDEEAARRAGADDFLTKPFQSIRQLVNKVTDLLNQRPAAPPAAASFADTLEFENRAEAPAETPAAADYGAARSEYSEAPGYYANAANEYGASRPFDAREEYAAPAAEYGDAGMDDEMIETSPASEYGAGQNSFYQNETTIDYAKTQPLNADDLRGFSLGGDRAPAAPAEEAGGENEILELAPETAPAAEEREAGSAPAEYAPEADYASSGYAPADYAPADYAPEAETPEAAADPQLDYYAPAENAPTAENAPAESYEAAARPDEPAPAPEFGDAGRFAPDAEPAAEYRPAPAAEYRPEDRFEAAPAENDAAPEAETETAPEVAPEAESETAPEAETAPAAHDEYEAEQYAPAAHDESAPEAPAETEAPAAFEEQAPEAAAPEAPAESYETAPDAAPETPAAFYEAAPEAPAAFHETAPADEVSAEAAPPAVEEEPAPAPELIDEAPVAAPAAFAALDAEDGDLLELPPLVEETGIRPQPKPVVVETAPVAEAPVEAPVAEEPAAVVDAPVAFPPELIDAIAQKVAEQISAKTLSDVLPQITELVMKKMAEEKKE